MDFRLGFEVKDGHEKGILGVQVMNIISEGLHRYSLDFQGLDQMHDLILLCCCSWKIIINVAAGPHQKDHKNMHMGGIILPQHAVKVVKGSMLKAKPTFPKP